MMDHTLIGSREGRDASSFRRINARQQQQQQQQQSNDESTTAPGGLSGGGSGGGLSGDGGGGSPLSASLVQSRRASSDQPPSLSVPRRSHPLAMSSDLVVLTISFPGPPRGDLQRGVDVEAPAPFRLLKRVAALEQLLAVFSIFEMSRISGHPAALGSRQLTSANSCHACCSLSFDEPESPEAAALRHLRLRHLQHRHLIQHNGLILQILAIIKEAGFPGDSIKVMEPRGMRPLGDTRPGDLVAL